MAGDGADVTSTDVTSADPPSADLHSGLCADLRLLRLHGVPRARTLAIPRLLAAADRLGHREQSTSADLAVTALLRQAVDRLGESREATAAERSFGLAPGHKLWKAADRRRAAAQAQGVSPETFRKSYELAIIDQLASEILGLLDEYPRNGRPAPESPGVPPPRRPDPGPADPGPPVAPLFEREHHVADVIRAAHATADWALVEGIYQQGMAIASNPHVRFLPDAIPAFFAEALGRTSANYAAREEELILHGLGVLGNAEHANRVTPELFQRLYTDERVDRFFRYSADARRRPGPFETLVETARRLRDLGRLRAALTGVPTSAVLSGSVDYGRFFTVRGHTESLPGSNLDLVLVVADHGVLDRVAPALSTLQGADGEGLAALVERVGVWRGLGLDDGHTVFSHRLPMWSDQPDPLMAWAPNRGRYLLDLHVVSLPVLRWILVADSTMLSATVAGGSRSVRDYCQDEGRRDELQRGFSGRNLRTQLDVSEVDRGLLRTHRVYSIHEDRYYPGPVQNLILPRFTLPWEDEPVRGALEAFRWKVAERLRHERRAHPYELLRMSMSHPRSEAFAPHVLRAVDAGELT
ncbi:MAG TPA: hypothetical protein VGH99_12455 [Pseudonocardia sp.]|jgi:hypothetical protein